MLLLGRGLNLGATSAPEVVWFVAIVGGGCLIFEAFGIYRCAWLKEKIGCVGRE